MPRNILLRPLYSIKELDIAINKCNENYKRIIAGRKSDSDGLSEEIISNIDQYYRELLPSFDSVKINNPEINQVFRKIFSWDNKEELIRYFAHLEEINGYFIAPKRALDPRTDINRYEFKQDRGGNKYFVYPEGFERKPEGYNCIQLTTPGGWRGNITRWYITPHRLEGFFPLNYLITYGYFLFSTLLKFYNRKLGRKAEVAGMSMEGCINHLKKELLRTLDAVILHYSSCVFRYNHGISSFEENLKSSDLIETVLGKIINLENGNEFIIPTGWRGHAIYVNFCMKEDCLVIRVDNGGEGVDAHQRVESVEARPYVVGNMKKLEIQQVQSRQRNFLVDYIAGIILAGYCDYKQAQPLLYRRITPISELLAIENQWQLYSLQKVGNCAIHNHKIGAQYRLPAKLFKILTRLEKQFITAIHAQEHQLELQETTVNSQSASSMDSRSFIRLSENFAQPMSVRGVFASSEERARGINIVSQVISADAEDNIIVSEQGDTVASYIYPRTKNSNFNSVITEMNRKIEVELGLFPTKNSACETLAVSSLKFSIGFFKLAKNISKVGIPGSLAFAVKNILDSEFGNKKETTSSHSTPAQIISLCLFAMVCCYFLSVLFSRVEENISQRLHNRLNK